MKRHKLAKIKARLKSSVLFEDEYYGSCSLGLCRFNDVFGKLSAYVGLLKLSIFVLVRYGAEYTAAVSGHMSSMRCFALFM